MSGLYVVEEAADFHAVQRELRRLDDRLDLTFEIDSRTKRRVYQVLCEYAGDHVAVLCEWRDEWGYPLPLSSGLVEQVRSQRSEPVDFAELNEAKIERELREADEAMDEIAADMVPRIRGRSLPIFQRGAHLRRSRYQRRERGENV